MKIVAAIPARGGSVGLPGKNIRPLNGVPLVGRTIRAARGSRYVSEVFVSSDSDEILAVAQKYGAVGCKRPDELSGPTASSESALLHLLSNELSLVEDPPDILVFLQCTAPFTLAHHVDQVVEALLEQQATSAISVVDDHGFYWSIGADGAGVGANHDPKTPRRRRQDLSPRYRENGAVYAMRVPEFVKESNRYCGKTALVPMDSTWIEIDTSQDWDIAEAFIKSEPFTGFVDRSLIIPIKALITDFDGVHTDNSVFIGQDGSETVVCSRTDEGGLERLRARAIRLLVMTSEANPIVKQRAKTLQMELLAYGHCKLEALEQWRLKNSFEWAEMAYVGADTSDLLCMQACGLSIAPRNAMSEVKAVSSIVLEYNGGQGALRELSELLISRDLLA